MNKELKQELDGITQISVYSKSKVELRRFLSNFAKVDIQATDGRFQSIKGYWLGFEDSVERESSKFSFLG